MERALASIRHRVVLWLTLRQPRRQGGGSWAYPPSEEAIGESGFKGIRKCFMRRQNTVAKYIVIQPILYLCERSNQRPGVRVYWWWWEQSSTHLERVKKRASEAATILELESDLESESGLESESESESELELDTETVPGGFEESSGASRLSGAEWSGAEE